MYVLQFKHRTLGTWVDYGYQSAILSDIQKEKASAKRKYPRYHFRIMTLVD